ncbi:hypothetical protein [Blastomonas fulva]|nr:hypothetical protein [Blastomonas fulva]
MLDLKYESFPQSSLRRLEAASAAPLVIAPRQDDGFFEEEDS